MKDLIKHLEVMAARPEVARKQPVKLVDLVDSQTRAEIKRKYRALGSRKLAKQKNLSREIVEEIALFQNYGRDPQEPAMRWIQSKTENPVGKTA